MLAVVEKVIKVKEEEEEKEEKSWSASDDATRCKWTFTYHFELWRFWRACCLSLAAAAASWVLARVSSWLAHAHCLNPNQASGPSERIVLVSLWLRRASLVARVRQSARRLLSWSESESEKKEEKIAFSFVSRLVLYSLLALLASCLLAAFSLSSHCSLESHKALLWAAQISRSNTKVRQLSSHCCYF